MPADDFIYRRISSWVGDDQRIPGVVRFELLRGFIMSFYNTFDVSPLCLDAAGDYTYIPTHNEDALSYFPTSSYSNCQRIL
jgi:hypothetical protein